MIKLLSIIIILLFLIYMVYKLFVEYRNSKTLDEKTIFWLVLAVFMIPITVYYIDRLDFISKLGWFENSSSDRWFSFFETYFSTIISAVIAAVVLIIMTRREMELEREKDLFDKRIQNEPIFKYKIDNLHMPPDEEFFVTNKIKGNSYSLFMNVENLGLNHARDLEFVVFDDVNIKEQVFKLDAQSFFKKDGSKIIQFVFNYKHDLNIQKNNNKRIQIIVRYQDLLGNDYQQNICIYVEVTNTNGSQYGGYKLFIVGIDISNEKYVEKKCIKC